MKQALGGKSNLFTVAHSRVWMEIFVCELEVFLLQTSVRYFLSLCLFSFSRGSLLSYIFTPLPLCFFFTFFLPICCWSLHTWHCQLAPGAHWVQLIVTAWGFVTYIEPLWPKGHFMFHWVHPAFREVYRSNRGSLWPLIRVWRCLLTGCCSHS